MLLLLLAYYLKINWSFDNKVQEYMAKEDERYFVIKHIKSFRFFSLVLAIFFTVMVFITEKLDVFNIMKYEVMAYNIIMFIIAFIFYGIFAFLILSRLIYVIRSFTDRIEYDNGQIKLYRLNKVLISEHLGQIDAAETYRLNDSSRVSMPSARRAYHERTIVFNSGRVIAYSPEMFEAHKIEAILKKREYMPLMSYEKDILRNKK